ncbi:MAG: GntR family transcriptional regulator [Enterocloster sp.]
MAFEIVSGRDPEESSRDYAYRLLRKNIMMLHLEPGTVLSEGDLSEQLGMSRTPVHEALILLKNEGLVDILPQRGSKVSFISLSFVKEGFFMRQILEAAIIEEIAGTLTPEQMRLLKDNLEQQERVLRDSSGQPTDEFFDLDDRLHRYLYEFSRRQRIWSATHSLNSHYDRIRYLDTIINTVDLSKIVEQHNTLYYYLLLGIPGDVDIRKFCRRHLGRFQIDFKKTIASRPGYFVD